MKTYDEMAKNALERIAAGEKEQKKRRKTVYGIMIPAVGFCLTALISVGAWQSGLFTVDTPMVADGNTEADAGIYAAEIAETGITAQAEAPDATAAINTAAEVISAATEKPENNDNIVSAPDVQDTGAEKTPDIPTAPVETGVQKSSENTSSGDYIYFRWKNKFSITGRLNIAISDRPGEVFAVRAEYRPTTADISSFSCEGKTLGEWAVEAYGPEASQDAKKGYELAYNAYMETTVLPSAERSLSAAGIRYEQNGGLIIFVTADELEKLPLEDMSHWYFDLAPDDLK